MRAGFSLIEVVVALLILEVSVVGVLGTVVVATQIEARAERIERGTARAVSVLDSLRGADGFRADSVSIDGDVVSWARSGPRLTVTARTDLGDTVVSLSTRVLDP